jgi:hypothetical protein
MTKPTTTKRPALLVARELTRIARCPATAAGIGAHLAVVAAFTLAWSGGDVVPVLPGGSLFEQQRHAQWLGLVAVVPWMTARVAAGERGDRLARLAARVGAESRQVVVARLSGAAVLACLVAAAPLPLVALAQQVSEVPAWSVALSLVELLGAALAAAFVTIAWTLRSDASDAGDAREARLARWLAATATTAALLMSVRAALRALGGA